MRHSAKGFTLIEMLITILLIAIGLLGMMAMQGRSILYTADSLHRTQAVLLANELIEIVRASPSHFVDDGTFYFDGTLPSAGGSSCLELDDTDTLIQDQFNCWGSKVRRLLPGTDSSDVTSNFRACLTTTAEAACGTGAALEITIAWRGAGDECSDPEDDDAAQVCTYQVRTQI